jgi:pre-mRNA-splicing factor ATP-dependent RNA helicase DHX16
MINSSEKNNFSVARTGTPYSHQSTNNTNNKKQFVSNGSMSINAATSKETTHWCSDALHDLLGFADTALASYLISVARKSKPPTNPFNAVLEVLEEGGCTAPVDQQHVFARNLVQRVLGTTARSGTTAQQRQVNNADWVKAASKYKLVDVDDFPDDSKDGEVISKSTKDNGPSKSAETSYDLTRKDKKNDKKRRYRNSNNGDVDDEQNDGRTTYNGEQSIKYRETRTRRRSANNNDESEIDAEKSALTADEVAELDRERDIRERDEMVQRMLDRDQKNTKQKVKLEQQDEEYEKQIETEQRLLKGESVVDEKTGNTLSLERLREQSRRAYLKKREERELTLLKQSLEDEETLFKGAKLTEAEQKRIELSRQILAVVDERGTKEDKHDGFYHLPDELDVKQSKTSQDEALLTSRYVETKREKTEGELWEESQTQKAAGFKKKTTTKVDEYELVFDDQIDFVMQESTKGYDRRNKKHISKLMKEQQIEKEYPESRPITEHEKILAGRKKLPVFPYREEFLAAVKDHQILILVGETGSGW